MKILVDIILRFLAQILGRWISFSIVKTIIVEFVQAGKTAFLLYVADLVHDILVWVADNVGTQDVLHPQQAIIRFLLERCGLELEGFTKEDMLKAAGKLMANNLNEKLGTKFDNLYPIDEFNIKLKNELSIQLLNGGGILIPLKVINQFKAQLQNNNDILTGYTGVAIKELLTNDSVTQKIKKRRNNNRLNQKKYRETHKKVQVWIPSGKNASALILEFNKQVKLL